jgi:5-methylthioadenosine/S-adenosylhomocysteine deaminase
MTPAFDMLNNLIYSADGKDVVLTMCDGNVLYRNGSFLTMDVERVRAEADAAMKKILSLVQA